MEGILFLVLKSQTVHLFVVEPTNLWVADGGWMIPWHGWRKHRSRVGQLRCQWSRENQNKSKIWLSIPTMVLYGGINFDLNLTHSKTTIYIYIPLWCYHFQFDCRKTSKGLRSFFPPQWSSSNGDSARQPWSFSTEQKRWTGMTWRLLEQQ